MDTATPIFDRLVATVPEVCGSQGPRIGDDSSPRCAQELSHAGMHRGFEGSGYEREAWGEPLMRDTRFVREFTEHLLLHRRQLFLSSSAS
jgi:hypothetical protein